MDKREDLRTRYFSEILKLSEQVGINVIDMIRFGTTLMNGSGIQSYDLDDRFFLTTSQYLTFFELNLPYTFANEGWPDKPFQFMTPFGRPDNQLESFDAKLTKWEVAKILDLFEKRIVTNMPTQYITNENWFVNRTKFYCDESVLLPQSYFAGMFDKLLEQQEFTNYRILDMCTGSGCIGITLALMHPAIHVDLVDISPAALNVAQKNIDRHGVVNRVNCIHSDLFSEVGSKYDMIITNPPWFGESDMDTLPEEARKLYPKLALQSGKEGMDHIDKILPAAPEYLNHDNASLVMTEIPKKQTDLIKQQYDYMTFEEFTPVNYDGSSCQLKGIADSSQLRIERKDMKSRLLN